MNSSRSSPLPRAESMTVEFKSDLKRLSDDELVEALVCLANADGGELWLGVEDDGTPTGLHEAHRNLAGLSGLATVEADQVFLQLVIEQESRQEGAVLPIDSLIALATLREQKRLGAEELAGHIHRDQSQAKRTLERLVEAGLVQPHGNTRNRSYTLSAEMYRAKGEQVAYTRQVGFSSLQHEQMVLGHVRHHGRIRRSEVIELCHLTGDQAAKLLKRLKTEGRLVSHGEKRGAFYTLSKNEPL